jgi:hypothetical protein
MRRARSKETARKMSDAPPDCTVDNLVAIDPETLGKLCGDRWAIGRSEEEFLKLCGINTGIIAKEFRVERVPTLAAVAAAAGAQDPTEFWSELWHGGEFSALELNDVSRRWFLAYFVKAAQDRREFEREQQRAAIDLARERREQNRLRFSKYGS